MNKYLQIFNRFWFLFTDSLKTTDLKTTIKRIWLYFTEPVRFKEALSPISDAYELRLLKRRQKAREPHFVKQTLDKLRYTPIISVITPVFNAKAQHLESCIQSVLDQTYPHVELCLYDDASTDKNTLSVLIKYAEKHPDRIKLRFGQENVHISEASNRAIALSKGEFIALLDHDDYLEPHAIMEVALALNKNKDLDFLYSDEDKITEEGKRHGYYFKSDFDETLLLSNNYITHLAVIRRTLGEKVGWFRKGFEGAQDHDLFLRLTEATTRIHHIPKILYAWRQTSGSTASSHSEKNYAKEAGRKAVKEAMKRRKLSGIVSFGPWDGAYHVTLEPKNEASVGIIIPFKDQVAFLKKCVSSILNKTDYSNYTLYLVNNGSQKEETLAYLNELKTEIKVKQLDYNLPFNFSAINNFAVSHCKEELVLLLNNDTQVINEQWLKNMAANFEDETVGVVGAELWYDDDTLQHAGVILGIGKMAGHAFKGFPAKSYLHFSQGLKRQYSAVTGACLLTRRKLFEKVGGLDEDNFKIALNDIDFCLKIRELGYKVIFEPKAKLYHFESKSRGYEDTPEKMARFQQETQRFQRKWGKLLFNDPFYNSNLTLEAENFGLRKAHENYE